MEFDTSKSQPHIYQPLPGPNHIRLIDLEPALVREEPLRFTFRTGELMVLEAQFEAISYTWGEPLLIYPLYVDDGTHVMVTANLDHALRQLRLPVGSRLLWADAVCINQPDNEEKASQIPLMTKIYRYARRVQAWVSGDQEEEEGMQHLSRLARSSREAVELQMRSYDQSALPCPLTAKAEDCIRRFLHLSWFSRLWVVQEIVFNNDVTLLCRKTELSWSRLATALSIIQNTLPEAVISISPGKIEELLHIARLWRHHCMIEEPQVNASGKYEDVLTVFGKFSTYGCTDPRDRIYALYSMTSDIAPTQCIGEVESYRRVYMDVDYSINLQQTYRRFAIACVRSRRLQGLLDAVLARQHSPPAENWPSWVPDWRKTPLTTYFKLGFVRTVLDRVEDTFNYPWHNRVPPDLLPINLSPMQPALPGHGLPIITRKIQTEKSSKWLSSTLCELAHHYPLEVLAHMLWILLGYRYHPDYEVAKLFSYKKCCGYLLHIADDISHSPNPLDLPPEFYSNMTEQILDAMQDQCLFIAHAQAEVPTNPIPTTTCVGYGTSTMQIGDVLRDFYSIHMYDGGGTISRTWISWSHIISSHWERIYLRAMYEFAPFAVATPAFGAA